MVLNIIMSIKEIYSTIEEINNITEQMIHAETLELFQSFNRKSRIYNWKNNKTNTC